MPELRQNFFTKEWVILATDRAKPPEKSATHRVAAAVASFWGDLPILSGQRT